MRILNLEPEGYSEKARLMIETIGQVENGPLSRDELISQIKNYDILITRLGYKIDREVLDAAPNLKIVVTATTGLNHIDLNAVKERSMEVLSLRGETEFLNTISATAEHSWGLLLALLRNIPAAHADAVSGQWNRDLYKGNELAGKTIGIIGCGRLGRKVARYAEAFDMKVLVHDKNKISGWAQVGLNELLGQSNIVSVHLSYDETTHRFLSKEQFALMKPGAILINTARGEVIDESALLGVLENKKLAGAALDVLGGENSGKVDWQEHDPLIAYAVNHRNLLITPHIGGATHESMEKTEIFMAEKLRLFLNSKAVK